MAINLDSARNLLYPLMVSFAEQFEQEGWDLVADHAANSLNIVSPKGERSEILTHEEINNSQYKYVYGPRLRDAMQAFEVQEWA